MVALTCRLLQPGHLRILLLLAVVGVATAAQAQTTGVITGLTGPHSAARLKAEQASPSWFAQQGRIE